MHWMSSEEHRRLSDAGRKKGRYASVCVLNGHPSPSSSPATVVFSLGLITGVVVGVGLVLALRRS